MSDTISTDDLVERAMADAQRHCIKNRIELSKTSLLLLKMGCYAGVTAVRREVEEWMKQQPPTPSERVKE